MTTTFKDLCPYNIFDGYMSSDLTGIELGFVNDDAVYDDDDEIIFNEGNPIFTHINFYPKSDSIISDFPFDITFEDTRTIVSTKAGKPTKTNQGRVDIFEKDFLIDHYKIGDLVISFDYNTELEIINFIQIRDNNLRPDLQI